MKRTKSAYLQTTLTDIPSPGMGASIANALALTFRVIVLFQRSDRPRRPDQ